MSSPNLLLYILNDDDESSEDYFNLLKFYKKAYLLKL